MLIFKFSKKKKGRHGGPSQPALSAELAPSTHPCQISFEKCCPHLQAAHHKKQKISSNAPHRLLYGPKEWSPFLVEATHIAGHLALSTAKQPLPINHSK